MVDFTNIAASLCPETKSYALLFQDPDMFLVSFMYIGSVTDNVNN